MFQSTILLILARPDEEFDTLMLLFKEDVALCISKLRMKGKALLYHPPAAIQTCACKPEGSLLFSI